MQVVQVGADGHVGGPARRRGPASWRSTARRCSPATSSDAARTATARRPRQAARRLAGHRGPRPHRPDGFVYLIGRAKDLIIRGGHNIDPAVIENTLLAHPQVTAARPSGDPTPTPARYPSPTSPSPPAPRSRGRAARLGEPSGYPTGRGTQDGHRPRRAAGHPRREALQARATADATRRELRAALHPIAGVNDIEAASKATPSWPLSRSRPPPTWPPSR